MVLRGLLYIVIFYITIVLFLPKNEIISFVDTKLLRALQITHSVNLENKLFGYQSKNSNFLYKKNIEASVENIEINPYLFYYSLELSQIKLKGIVGSFFPNRIEKAVAVYNITNPTQIFIDVTGEFGKASGYFDISTFKIHLEVIPSSIMKKNYSFILNNLKKSNQIYIYEYKL